MDLETVRSTKNQLIEAVTLLQRNRVILTPDAVMRLKDNIWLIAGDAEKKYPYICSRLKELRKELFLHLSAGYTIDSIKIGQIVELLDYLLHEAEIPEQDTWSLIHPRIIKSSQKLYFDGSYTNAATDAFIEINERLKNIYTIISPGNAIPDGTSLMTTIFSPNKPLLQLCDINNTTGKDKQTGLMNMAQGAISALRNPKSHSNSEIVSAEEAMRRLMFASMIMYQIDEAVAYSCVVEQ